MKDGGHTLSLSLHGPFHAAYGGQDLRISSRRGRAQLAMLACSPEHCLSRAKVQLALWEDRSEVQARTSLRQELATLRRALGPAGALIGTDGEWICLSPDSFDLQPARDGAVFLDGLEIPSNTFEEWLRTQRAAAPAASPPPATDLFKSPGVLLLPFKALSASEEDSLLARGLGEDIRTTLACYRWFPVIGPEALGPDTEQTSITDLAARVSAAYVVTGTVRRAGQRARVTAQLVDGANGQQLWSQTFDGELVDVFAFQEEVAARVVAQIEPEILHATEARIDPVRPDTLEIWELLIQVAEVEANGGEGYGTPDANRRQAEMLGRILARDDTVAEAWARLARCHFRDMLLGWSDDRAASLKLAMETSARAIELNPNDWLARSTRAVTLIFGATDPVAARSHAEAAVRLNPSSPLAHHAYGCVMVFLGRNETARAHLNAVFRLNPNWGNAAAIHADLMVCAALRGDFDSAVEHGRKMMAIAPGYVRGLQRVAAVFGHAGLIDEGKQALATLESLGHRFDEAYLRETYPFQRVADVDFLLAGLRRLGWSG